MCPYRCGTATPSRAWYGDVLGFEMIEEVHDERYDEWVLLHPRNGVVLCMQQHRSNGGEEFDPARTGGDHVALRVASRADLNEWKLWLEKLDASTPPSSTGRYGSVLCFKDPDRIQLELFYRENHP